MKKLNIAIIGLGNIGSYLFVLEKNKKIYLKKIIALQISFMFLLRLKRETRF